MPKSLYLLHPDSNAVVTRDGAGALTTGAIQGLITPRVGSEATNTWFSYAGVAYCAFLTFDSLTVCKLNGADLELVTSIPAPSGNVAWGNVVHMGDTVLWMQRHENGTVHVLSFNGSTLTKKEVTGVPAVLAPFDREMEMLTLSIEPHALVVHPSGAGVSHSDTYGAIRGRAWRLSIVADGDAYTCIKTPVIPGFEPPTLNAPFCVTDVEVSRLGSRCILADGTFRSPNGIRDLRRDTHEHIPVVSGSTEALVIAPNYLAMLGPSLIGGRFTSTSGEKRTVLQCTVDGIVTTTRGTKPEQNDEFSFAPGLVLSATSETTAGVTSHVHWHESGDTVIAAVLGRGVNVGSTHVSPSILITDTPSGLRVRKLVPLSAWGSSVSLDPTDSSASLVYVDGISRTIRSVRFDLSSGAFASGVVVAPIAPCSLAPNAALLYSAGEPSAVITSVICNAESGNIELTVNTTSENIELLYSLGSAWKRTTRVIVSGSLLVHNLAADEPGYVGPIQYCLNVTA